MQAILPPLCFVLAIFSFVAGFTTMSVPEPEPGIELHKVRSAGDEKNTEILEARLEEDQDRHQLKMYAFYGAGVLLAAAGFVLLTGPGARKRS